MANCIDCGTPIKERKGILTPKRCPVCRKEHEKAVRDKTSKRSGLNGKP